MFRTRIFLTFEIVFLKLENVVCLEFLLRNHRAAIGKTCSNQIDFIATGPIGDINVLSGGSFGVVYRNAET